MKLHFLVGHVPEVLGDALVHEDDSVFLAELREYQRDDLIHLALLCTVTASKSLTACHMLFAAQHGNALCKCSTACCCITNPALVLVCWSCEGCITGKSCLCSVECTLRKAELRTSKFSDFTTHCKRILSALVYGSSIQGWVELGLASSKRSVHGQVRLGVAVVGGRREPLNRIPFLASLPELFFV